MIIFKNYFLIKCIVFCVVFLILIVYLFFPMEPPNFSLTYSLFEFKKTKYITMTQYGGRLANNIFRFATLYGIGRRLDRIPYIPEVDSFQLSEIEEMLQIFPLMRKYYPYKPNVKSLKVVNFTGNCCKYEELPREFFTIDDEYIKLSSTNLQVPKHFDHVKNELQKIMECSNALKQQVSLKAGQIWKKGESPHKLCAHVRREDFITQKAYKETTHQFLMGAIEFVYQNIRKSADIKAISLIIVGDDENFIKNLTFSNQSFKSITKLSSGKNRGFDMCFAIEYCDTFLLSSSMSTFGWWIGYLMKSQGTVYYDAEISYDKSFGKFIYPNDGYPLQWKKLAFVNETKFILL